MSQRSTRETVQWYRDHETAEQLGFDPNGMCLRICRTARNLGPVYPSAVTAQNATPAAHRVYGVADVRRGMVAYYDDPNDSNPYGHIVTVVGRDRDADPDALNSLLVRSNSVVSHEVVVVRGDYFPTHWGDSFQFAATWLNGVALDLPDSGPAAPPTPTPAYIGRRGTDRLLAIEAELSQMIENHRRFGNQRIVRALKRDRDAVRQTLRNHTQH